MLRLSVNEVTTFRWSFEEDVARYAEAGLQAIGVWRQKLSDCGVERAVELLQEHDLQVSNFCWAGGFTGSDGRTYRESLNDAHEAIQIAAAIGARCLVVYSGARAGHTLNHARRLIHSALTELVPLAEEFGVDLAVEPMHRDCASDWTFLTSLDDTLELLDAAGSPHLKLVFDTYHLGFDPTILERIDDIAHRIGVVHLGDGKTPPCGEQNRCLLGEGRVPLQDIIRKLIDAGYTGFFDVELIGEELESCDYGELLNNSKQVASQMLAEVL